jgi:hypothetical protein
MTSAWCSDHIFVFLDIVDKSCPWLENSIGRRRYTHLVYTVRGISARRSRCHNSLVRIVTGRTRDYSHSFIVYVIRWKGKYILEIYLSVRPPSIRSLPGSTFSPVIIVCLLPRSKHWKIAW